MSSQSVQINIRVSRKVAEDLERLAAQEESSRVDITKQILMDGIQRRKQELALRRYREGKVTKSRAAEIAGITVWEMMDLIDQARIPTQIPLEEAIAEVRQLVSGAVAERSTR